MVRGKLVSFQEPKAVAQKAELAQMFMLAARACGWKITKAPISASMTFVFSGRSRMHHKKRPDVDNLAKLVLDAGNGVLYEDDSQVCDLHIQKVYGSPLDGKAVGTFFNFMEITEEVTWTFDAPFLPSTSVRVT